MLVCGVDDAGRGSVLGPLVIAGVSLKRQKIRHLSEIGVKDSKQLSPVRREEMYKKIISIVDNYHVTKISPKIIDASVYKNQLNHLEAKYMAKVITKLKPDSSYIDSCDVNPFRFGIEVSRLANYGKIHSHHHADSRFVIVSAASIVAKVNRDREIAKLRKKYNLGSGYPSDSKTMQFIKNFFKEHKHMPQFVRKSWKPVRAMIN